MIRSVKRGLYAVNFGGGQVDITSGKYVFSATEAYLIEDGKVTAPVKGATLIGNGPETMQKVKMVGHDLALDDGVGVCVKDGQSVPVGVGQPSLLIDGLTVGCTQARGPGLGIGHWGMERGEYSMPLASNTLSSPLTTPANRNSRRTEHSQKTH